MTSLSQEEKRLAEARSASRRFDPFRLLTPQERARHVGAYRSFLEARNGEIDLEGRRLLRREQFFRSLALVPVTSVKPKDRSFLRHRLRGVDTGRLDQAAAWLVAVAKASVGESYGVELELAKYDRERREDHDRRRLDDGDEDAEVAQLYVFMEELYHGRLLAEMCTTLGYEMNDDPPNWRMRFLIHLINRMSDGIRWPLVLCAEIVGATCFKLFLDRCHLFADEPDVERRLRSLVGEIWRDEVLHVALLRARLGPRGMGWARRLFPLILGSLLRDVPELFEIGCTRDDFLGLLREGIEIPRDIDWIPSDAMRPA
jgi:hypothetical protein